jgi:hypothetical protein
MTRYTRWLIVRLLATGKPILALTPPDSEIGWVIRETRTGLCVGPKDTLRVKEGLLEMDTRLRTGSRIPEPNWEAIRFYSWPEIVARLARHTGLGAAHPLCESHN